MPWVLTRMEVAIGSTLETWKFRPRWAMELINQS